MRLLSPSPHSPTVQIGVSVGVKIGLAETVCAPGGIRVWVGVAVAVAVAVMTECTRARRRSIGIAPTAGATRALWRHA